MKRMNHILKYFSQQLIQSQTSFGFLTRQTNAFLNFARTKQKTKNICSTRISFKGFNEYGSRLSRWVSMIFFLYNFQSSATSFLLKCVSILCPHVRAIKAVPKLNTKILF